MKLSRVSVFLLTVLILFGQAGAQSVAKESVVVSGTIKLEKTFHLNGKVDLPERLAPGSYILFSDTNGNRFKATADEKGKYRITLPPGKYAVYATKNDKCWMCPEFYKLDFVVGKKRKVKLDALLAFIGEG